MTIDCNNLVDLFNKAYDDFKENKYNKNSCLKKVQYYETDELKIKIPNESILQIKIDNENAIYKPLGFILSNLNNKRFTQKKENDEAFRVLELLLNIIDITDMKDSNSKKLLDNIHFEKEMVKIIRFGRYIFTIPNILEVTINVTGENLATLTVDKLDKKGGKKRRFKLIRNKDKII